LPDLGAVKKEDAWVLPAKWDDLGALKSYWRDQESQSWNEKLTGVGDPFVFAQVNLAFLVSGTVGWVFLIVGLVVGIIGGGDEDGEKP
jgi:hypothetical protein